MKWYEADQRWSLYVKNKEEYLEKFVVTGKFHDAVPKDISDAFETVSYLMAHSYYHWPMYDEAHSKALLIMEMAIKLKAKILQLPLDHTTAKGKIIGKKLVEIIAEVLNHQNLSFLKDDFDRARNMRNFKVHPDSNFFMGGLGHAQTNIIRLVNTINLLFLDSTDLTILTKKNEDTNLLVRDFKISVYILELSDKKILIDSIESFKYIKSKNGGIYFLVINPILVNSYENLTNKKYSEPLVLSLKELNMETSGLNGIDMENNPIKIYTTDKTENLLKYQDYLSDMNRVSKSDKAVHRLYMRDCACWEIERQTYRYCW